MLDENDSEGSVSSAAPPPLTYQSRLYVLESSAVSESLRYWCHESNWVTTFLDRPSVKLLKNFQHFCPAWPLKDVGQYMIAEFPQVPWDCIHGNRRRPIRFSFLQKQFVSVKNNKWSLFLKANAFVLWISSFNFGYSPSTVGQSSDTAGLGSNLFPIPNLRQKLA